MPNNHEEREKRSWSEIDKLKDRSPHRRENYREGHRDRFQKERAMSKYKAQLEKFFSKDTKLNKDAQKELKKLREISDRADFLKQADAFIEEHGLPHRWEDLENFLRHKDSEILSETIRRMEALLSEQSDTRRGNFQKDLHLIEMITRDKDLRKRVCQVLKSLRESS